MQKLVHSAFFAYEYGIECYKKGMEYQEIKELAIENDNLIKRNRELLKSCEGATMMYKDLCKAKELLKDVYKIAMGDWNDAKWHDQVLREAEQFLNEVKK